jgi:hypothetical protein
VLVLVIGAWFAADHFGTWSKKQVKTPEPAAPPAAKTENKLISAPAKTEDSSFKTETYRDERFGFEFQYPVAVKDAKDCPQLEKTEDGLSLGMFTFAVSDKSGTLDDFIASELPGMEIDNKTTITVAGRTATKVDYQTMGMGWYGSNTFIEHNGKFIEFGLLANEAAAKCGGIDDYADRVYQSVLFTLKFTD